jgi:hypothetical protein
MQWYTCATPSEVTLREGLGGMVYTQALLQTRQFPARVFQQANLLRALPWGTGVLRNETVNGVATGRVLLTEAPLRCG